MLGDFNLNNIIPISVGIILVHISGMHWFYDIISCDIVTNGPIYQTACVQHVYVCSDYSLADLIKSNIISHTIILVRSLISIQATMI